MYLQIWSCSSHSQTSYIPIWFWFWFWFAVEIRSCFGMSNSVRCNIYLSWDSFSWYSGHLGGWFFLQSFIIFSNGVFLSFLNLVISVVFQWIHPRKVWGSLVTCGLFPGRFLNDFGLSWLDLICLKENLSIFDLESFLIKQRVDFHSTPFVVPVLMKSLTYHCLS